MEVSISSHEAEAKSVKKEMQNGKILHLSDMLSLDSDGYLTEAPNGSEGPDLVPTSDKVTSEGKDIKSLTEEQISGEESSLQASDGEGAKSVESKSCYLFGYFTASLNELIGKVFKDLWRWHNNLRRGHSRR